MAGKTTNYNLPTIDGTDQISLVNDFNGLANATDAALKTVEDKAAPTTITTTSGDFVTEATTTTATAVNKVTPTTANVINTVTGTPTTKTIATYADLDAHPELLIGYTVATTTVSVLTKVTAATASFVSAVTTAVGKAITSVTTGSNS